MFKRSHRAIPACDTALATAGGGAVAVQTPAPHCKIRHLCRVVHIAGRRGGAYLLQCTQCTASERAFGSIPGRQIVHTLPTGE